MAGRGIGCVVGALALGIAGLAVGALVADYMLERKVETDVRTWLDEQDLEHTVDFDHVSVSVPWRELRFHDLRAKVPGASLPLTADVVGCGNYWQTDGFPTQLDCEVEGLEAPADLITGLDPTGVASAAFGGTTTDWDARFGWTISNAAKQLELRQFVAMQGALGLEGGLHLVGFDVDLAKRLVQADDAWEVLVRLAGDDGERMATLALEEAHLRLEDQGLLSAFFTATSRLIPGVDAAGAAQRAAASLRANAAGSATQDNAEAIADWLEQGGDLDVRIGGGAPLSFFERGPTGLIPGPLMRGDTAQITSFLVPTVRHLPR